MKELFLQDYVMTTDYDAPIVASISVGFSEKLELTIRAEFNDYELRDTYGFELYVKKENAYRLARRLGVAMTELPELIAQTVRDYGDVVNADFKVAAACFFEMRDFLENHDCRYKIRRHYGRGGGIYVPPVLFRGNNFCI